MASARSIISTSLVQGMRTTILEYQSVITRIELYTFRLNREDGKSVIKSITISFHGALDINRVYIIGNLFSNKNRSFQHICEPPVLYLIINSTVLYSP